MNQAELLSYLDAGIASARASEDPIVRRSAAVLGTLKGSVLGGEEVFTAFIDNMRVINVNMTVAVRALQSQSQPPQNGG